VAQHLDDGQVKGIPIEDYETQVRPTLQSGDLVFASGNYLISQAIKQVTHSPWSHVGILFKFQQIDRILLLESVEDIGVRLAPVSKYLSDYENGQPYDGAIVFARTSILDPADFPKVADFGCDQLTLPYNTAEIAYILARITLKLGKKPDSKGYICSELVNACFKAAGHPFKDNDDFVTPEDVWCDDSVTLLSRVR
jgi:uncharacterized protein YycO